MTTDTAQETSMTPRLRRIARRSGFWIGVAALLALIAAFSIATSGSAIGAPALDAGSAAPDGSRAVVEVLREGGIDVRAAESFGQARAIAEDRGTLLLYDPDDHLSPARLRSLAQAAETMVLVQPTQTALDALAPQLAFAGVPRAEGSVVAGCPFPPAAQAASIPAGGVAYRILGPAPALGCFPTGDDAYSLVHVERDAGSIDVVGDTAVFTNESITQEGRAALALGLLDDSSAVAWYLPTAADAAGGGPASVGELTPEWVTPSVLLLIAVFLAAAAWRGRRFGPLVAESLPVVVHASETAEGRARLYARSSARLRALDSLRIGTTTRLSRLLGLPVAASLDDVARAVAALLDRDPAPVFALLVGDIPVTDADLIRLSDELLRLERAATHAIAQTGLTTAPGTEPETAQNRGTP